MLTLYQTKENNNDEFLLHSELALEPQAPQPTTPQPTSSPIIPLLLLNSRREELWNDPVKLSSHTHGNYKNNDQADT